MPKGMRYLLDMNFIKIRGARVHNLKNVDLDLPIQKLICFAGPSGSGKTSIAFHTLLAESKRRFLNSYPNSVKFFMDRPAAVDVDSIFPVLPVFGLPQINPILGSRAVASDVMRLTDSLQNLFFAYAKEFCPKHHKELVRKELIDQILDSVKSLKDADVFHVFISKSEFKSISSENFLPARSLDFEEMKVREFNQSDDFWEVGRFKWVKNEQLEKKLKELKLDKLKTVFYIYHERSTKKLFPLLYSSSEKCPDCDYKSTPVQTVSSFSPYSALGACSECNGYGANLVYDEKKMVDVNLSVSDGGVKFLNFAPFDFAFQELLKVLKKNKISTEQPIKDLPKEFFTILNNGLGNYPGFDDLKMYLDSKKYKPSIRVFIRKYQKEEPCSTCLSSRLNQMFSNYKINIGDEKLGQTDLMRLSISESLKVFTKKTQDKTPHLNNLISDIVGKLSLAEELGLGHLKLLRKAKSLSSGEYQRLLLIKYLSFKGTDSLFVFDEPSIGLDKYELSNILKAFRKIIDQGNTIVLIDHSEFLQKKSDYLIMMGPGSGSLGGEVTFKGDPSHYFGKIEESKLTLKNKTQKKSFRYIDVKSPEIFGKKYPDFKVPEGVITWVHGASGTGKTACLVKVLANYLNKKFNGNFLEQEDFKVLPIKCETKFKDIIVISSDLNRFTSRSTVGTLTELSSVVRKHFLKLNIAKKMNLKDGHLSSNSELGMCPRCDGKGFNVIEMQFLEDIILECEDCKGLKLKPIYANISDGEMTVSQAYNLPLNQVIEKIELTPKFRRVWEYLKILNLDYLSLDRSLSSLSGGEKQRIFLLSKILKKMEESFLILENISFGLSKKELSDLAKLLDGLLVFNNTIVIIDSSEFFGSVASCELTFSSEQIILNKIT